LYPLFRAASRPWTQALADASWFQTSVTLTIVAAGITVGIDVENAAEPHPYSDRFLNVFLWYADVVINWIFTVEVLVKLLGEDWHPWTYFYDNWNKFDFVIVFCSWLPLLLALLGGGGGGGLGALKLLRLLRLFRIMRVIKFLPELKVIIEALMVGMESIGFIALIMFVVFYLFAVAGMMLFASNDPFRTFSIRVCIFPKNIRHITNDDSSFFASPFLPSFLPSFFSISLRQTLATCIAPS
jgi:voltage-gated sodium channel